MLEDSGTVGRAMSGVVGVRRTSDRTRGRPPSIPSCWGTMPKAWFVISVVREPILVFIAIRMINSWVEL